MYLRPTENNLALQPWSVLARDYFAAMVGGLPVFPARISRISLFGSIALSLSCCLALSLPSKAAAAGSPDGAALYKQGRYQRAERALVDKLKRNPRDLAAHYYLALTLTKLGKLPLAIREFDYIVAAAPESEEAAYSFQALQALKPEISEPAERSGQPGSSEAAAPAQSPRQRSPQESARVNGLKRAVSKIKEQTDLAVQESAARQAEADRILRDAEEKAKPIDAQITQTKSSMRSMYRYTRSGPHRLYSEDDISAEIADLTEQAKKIREEAARRAGEIMKMAKERQAAQESAALDVERSLAAGERNGAVKIHADGTNLYVRTYETPSDSSSFAGGEIPLSASPKSLTDPVPARKRVQKH